MQVLFFAHWRLTTSALELGIAPQEVLASRGLSAVAAHTDLGWSVGGAGQELHVEVGPVGAEPEELRGGAELYHQLAEAVANQLPADGVDGFQSGPRLLLPIAPLGSDDLARLAGLAVPVLGPWMQHAGASRAELRWSRGGLEIAFDRRPVPESFDFLTQGAAHLVRVLVRDALWTDLPADLLEGPAASSPVVEPTGDASQARQVWQHVESELLRKLPRATFEALLRWLELPREVVPSVVDEQPLERAFSESPEGSMDQGLRIVPFRSGGRPLDELEEVGTGCSEGGGFVRSGREGVGEDDMWIVFRLADLEGVAENANLEVRASAWFLPHPGESGDPIPVPNFRGQVVEPQRVGSLRPEGPTLEPTEYMAGAPHGFVFRILPQLAFLPTEHPDGWTWEQAPEALRRRVPDGSDPYTFGSFFYQRIHLELTVEANGQPVARDEHEIKIYDLDRFGSLYGRLLDLVGKDTARQAEILNESEVYPGHHPWYPVLGIGMNKASFYMRAIIDDSRTQSCHLANPWWLLDVGLWLEYLTCVGVFEMVRETDPEMLSPAERTLLEEAPRFEEVRRRINPKRWSEVWEPRDILSRRYAPLAAGPVSFLNLLKKQEGTLSFLEAHHEDLIHAVELSGPNLVSSQEAWHRVFRDAERAVTNSSLAAFPELRHVPAAYREFALWHEKGDFGALPGGFLLPKAVSSAFGDQDGIYPSAARQYRESMNHVANVCQESGLMEHAGEECVPKEVSLIEALIDGDDRQFKVLQARDGYGGSLTATSQTLTLRATPGRRSIRELLRVHPLFETLSDSELEALTENAEVAQAVPTQEIVTQGADGSSMFVLESGLVDVEIQNEAGEVRTVRTMVPGEYFGELALLTGEPRSATVRAREYPTLIELSPDHIRPLIEARPELLDAMSETAAVRNGQRGSAKAGPSRKDLARRMRAHLLDQNEADDDPSMLESSLDLLRRLPLLEPLSNEEREILAQRADIRTFAAGTMIVRQGARGSSLYAVLAGRVAVYVNHKGVRTNVATIEEGDVFGEMALMTGERRSADVQADGDCTVLEISRADFLPVMTRRPALVVALSDILERRAEERRASGVPGASDVGRFGEGAGIRNRVKSFFFG